MLEAMTDGSNSTPDLVVDQLWRYPVKSMGGEQLTAATVTATGIEGDRSFGVRDEETGMILTGRRRPELLFATASWSDGSVAITLPDGSVTDDDRVLSAWLDHPVSLVAAGDPGTYENPLDAEGETDWVSWTGPEGVFHDSKRTQVSIVGRHSIGSWEPARFRTNVLCVGGGEDDLVDSDLTMGSVVVSVAKRIDRCVMVTRPQPGGIERDLDVLRTINRDRERCLGVGALVTTPGMVVVGDRLMVLTRTSAD